MTGLYNIKIYPTQYKKESNKSGSYFKHLVDPEDETQLNTILACVVWGRGSYILSMCSNFT